MANIIQADDRLIDRSRGGRTLVFFGTPALLAVFGGLLVAFLTKTFLIEALYWPGFVVGATCGMVAFLAMKHVFVVKNNTTGLLVTTDQLKSLVGIGEPNVIYGPGTHFSYPWEARFARNNIPVEEVAEQFTFGVICKDGTLTVPASIRFRPDFEKPIAYLSGVAAVAGDFKDLVISSVSKKLSKLTMQQALDTLEGINTELHDEFVSNKKTDFELRFGILVGDVTLGNLLMSDEAQRTRSGLNEAAMVAEGTALLLGFKTIEEMQAALANKSIVQDDVDRARRDFRIISGNMENTTVNRHEIDIKGLSPEIAAALAALFQNPAAAAAVRGYAGRKTTPEKGTRK